MTIDQEAENVAAQVLHLLIQRGTDARSWQARAEQSEGALHAARRELDRLREERQTLLDMLDPDATGQTLVGVVQTLSRQLAELTHLVGTETPIAALDLATTWQAEKAHVMEAYKEVVGDVARLQADLDAISAEYKTGREVAP